MTPDRFRSLADAYGGDLRRWPEADRTAAHALLAQGQPELHRLLAEARLLDDVLDSHTVNAPDPALVERIAGGAAAIQPSLTRPATRWRTAWWWPGAGLAGIGLAGSVIGAFVVSVALRSVAPPAVDWPERGTGFNALPSDWSEE